MFNDYARYYDAVNKKKPYAKECRMVYRWAGRPDLTLDIGFGTASYWKYFPHSHYRMMGVEKSEQMVNIARKTYAKWQTMHADINNIKWSLDKDDLVDCVTALFDVINYMSDFTWWNRLPLKKGGYFIFDVWNTEKIKKEGFNISIRRCKGFKRIIIPHHRGNIVDLDIYIQTKRNTLMETHRMYLYSEEDIRILCGKNFIVDDIRNTDTWQTWYRLRRKR